MKKVSISSIILFAFAFLVILNELTKSNYDMILAWGGMVVSVILILAEIWKYKKD